MKNHRSNTIKLLFAIAFTGVFSMTGLAQQAEKQITRDYEIEKGFTLGIDNKYGEINLVNWEDDALSVVITIQTEAGSQQAAEELLEQVDINIDESRSSVEFTTDYALQNFSGTKKVQVIYEVKAPAYINASLAQSYGHIFIQEIAGLADLKIRYGSINAGGLTAGDREQVNRLDLAYSQATLEFAAALNMEVKYSEANVAASDYLVIESAYSKIYLGSATEVYHESKYDKINVKSINGVLDIESAYTPVSVETIEKGFGAIDLEMKYGNFKAGLAADAGFSIVAEASYGNIRIPEGDYQEVRNGMNQYIEGKVGNENGSKISASLKYGNLVLDR